jgi:hypothetical protein
MFTFNLQQRDFAQVSGLVCATAPQVVIGFVPSFLMNGAV